MSPQSAPNKTDSSRFAVIVDPTGWPHDLERLAESVRSAYRASAPNRPVPGLAALLEKLRAGATTVAEGWGRERAQELQAALQAEGIGAKLMRRRPVATSSSTAAALGEPPAARVASAGAESAAPAPKAPSPLRSAPPPATLMNGWSRLTPLDPDSATVAKRVQTADFQSAAPAAGPSPPKLARPRAAGSVDAVGRMPLLGWGDVLDPNAAAPQLGRPSDDAPSAAEARAIERTEPRLLAQMPGDGVAAIPKGATEEALPAGAPPASEPTAPAGPPPRPVGWVDASPGPAAANDFERVGEQAANHRGEDPATARATQPELAVSAAFRALLEMPGRPVPSEELTPSPLVAMLFGVLAPGAGQVYLGRPDEGFRVAMAAPLVLPWISGARSAWYEAAQVVAGQRTMRTRPRPGAALLFVVGLWVCAALLVGGALWAYTQLTAPTGLSGAVAPAAVSPEPVDVTEMALSEPPLVRGAPIADEVERRQREARARRLAIQAHQACEAGDYPRCLSLSDQARRLEPELREAVRLFHRASLALESGTGTGTGAPGDEVSGPDDGPPDEGSP